MQKPPPQALRAAKASEHVRKSGWECRECGGAAVWVEVSHEGHHWVTLAHHLPAHNVP